MPVSNLTVRASLDIEVLAVLDLEALVPILRRLFFVHGLRERSSEIESETLRTLTGNLKIQDGEDVDVLRKPAYGAALVYFRIVFFLLIVQYLLIKLQNQN